MDIEIIWYKGCCGKGVKVLQLKEVYKGKHSIKVTTTTRKPGVLFEVITPISKTQCNNIEQLQAHLATL